MEGIRGDVVKSSRSNNSSTISIIYFVNHSRKVRCEKMTTDIQICREATQDKKTNKDNFGTLWVKY